MPAQRDTYTLLGDIGGTNSRFSLLTPNGSIEALASYANANYCSLDQVIRSFLTALPTNTHVTDARIALACPVLGDQIALTNRNWSFSCEEMRTSLGLHTLDCINDLTAIALAIPHLSINDVVPIGGGQPIPNTPIGVVAPGTGLGISALIPTQDGYHPIATEGGHCTLPSFDELEEKIVAYLRTQYGHVSAERVLSGQGLVNLYNSLAHIHGLQVETLEPQDISAQGQIDTQSLSAQTLSLFFAFLGTVSANCALTFGALGGIYISGGIVPNMTGVMAKGNFRKRFETKGRFSGYLGNIPTYVVTHPNPALIGLANMKD